MTQQQQAWLTPWADDDDPFRTRCARDGFHVVRVDRPTRLVLAVVTVDRGSVVSAGPLADFGVPGPKARGRCDRLLLVLDAVCRYLTTGGGWDELRPALERLAAAAPSGLCYPGYYLATSYLTDTGDYQHVFVKDDGSGRAVLWQEPSVGDNDLPVGGWIDVTTLAELGDDDLAGPADDDEAGG